MKLIASLIVRNELGRYLEPCVAHLLEFCEEIRVLDDASTDGWVQELHSRNAWGKDGARVVALLGQTPSFFEHEGRARQALLDFTLRGTPTHVLAIDADEFVADGDLLRSAIILQDAPAFDVCMQEVWNAHEAELELRQDGGWSEHDVTVVWRPDRLPKPLRIADRALACGRTPEALRTAVSVHTGTALLHFGWANRAERAARHDRYVVADGGKFHASAHLDSIMLPDSQVTLNSVGWPDRLLPYRAAILERSERRDAP